VKDIIKEQAFITHSLFSKCAHAHTHTAAAERTNYTGLSQFFHLTASKGGVRF